MLNSEQTTDLSDDMIMNKIMNMNMNMNTNSNSNLPGPISGFTKKMVNPKSHSSNKSPKGIDPLKKYMEFIYRIFKNYCKIGFVLFGVIFMANIIKSFDRRKIIIFFKLFATNIIRSGIFGLFWPISIFKLSTNKKIKNV